MVFLLSEPSYTPNMIIYICDDDAFDTKSIMNLLEEYRKEKEIPLTVNTFSDGDSMFACGQDKDDREPDPDIILMDIELGAENGIEIASKANELWPESQIIYLSNYLSFSTEVYNTRHIYYVIKEQAAARLPEALDKAIQNSLNSRSTAFFHLLDNTDIWLKLDSIIYLERNVRITIIHTEEKEYLIRNKLNELPDLLSSGQFSRCHNSFIINLAKVRKKTPKSYIMSDGREIMISRKYRGETVKQFLLYNQFMMP